MKINFHRRYIKQYNKLSISKKDSVNDALMKFEENPFDESLYNHSLKGKRGKKGQRSISAESDLRIIFEMDGNYAVVLFVEVGSHSLLYG